MTCGLILSALRLIPHQTAEVRAFRWPNCTGGELAGKTLGIYGMGKIGYTAAKRLSGFDLGAILYSDVIRSERGEQDLGAQRAGLDALFSCSDALSIHAPLTPQTEGVVGLDLLRRMKRTSVLVNTARAGIVDPSALRKALAEGRPACAAFDGYYTEGIDLTNELEDPYGLLCMGDRFFATSHQGFNTRESLRKASEEAVRKVCQYLGTARAA
jgi:D-3-phosphoglycerate dehydrogenase